MHNDLDLAKEILDGLRLKCVILIVSFHGGGEGNAWTHLPHGHEIFLEEDRGDLRTFSHFCIDNGADIVYGHGRHVVRCLEVYKKRLIAYSLGNFCTPYGMNVKGRMGYAPILEIKILNDGTFVEGQIHSFIQQKGKGPRRDSSNIVVQEMRQLSYHDFQNNPIVIDNNGHISLKHIYYSDKH